MPALLDAADEQSMREFGRLMTVTHDGDRLHQNGAPYLESRTRLADVRLTQAFESAKRGDPRPLRDEPGFYGASIPELDRMVDVSLATPGVLGAGLMGAGGGGYVLILAREGALPAISQALTREYYTPLGKEPDIEAWHPTAAACRLA
jgi:galactokinase